MTKFSSPQHLKLALETLGFNGSNKELSRKQLKSAYFEKSKLYHPDIKNVNAISTSFFKQPYTDLKIEESRRKEEYLKVQEAYQFLRINYEFVGDGGGRLNKANTPFQHSNSSGLEEAQTASNRFSPKFRNQLQILGLGLLGFLIFNFALVKRQERNVQRQKEFGWTLLESAHHNDRKEKEGS